VERGAPRLTEPRRDVVLLNAAAALTVAGRATSIEHGLELAATSIDDGAAASTLDRWIVASTAEPSGPR